MSSDMDDAILQTLGFRTGAGIKYKLMEGFPKGTVTDEGETATEEYLIKATNLLAFLYESKPPPIFPYLGRSYLPARRKMPGAPWLVTKSISFEPFPSGKPCDPFSAHVATFSGSSKSHTQTFTDLVKVTIQYETKKEGGDQNDPDSGKPETILEHSMTAGAQFLSIPPAKTKTQNKDVDGKGKYPNAAGTDFANNQDPPRDNASIRGGITWVIPTVEHTLKFPLVRNPPWETLFSTLGKVNDEEIEEFFYAKQETVLFMGFSGSQKYLWDGASARVQPWSLDLQFSQRYVNRGGTPAVEAAPAQDGQPAVVAVPARPSRTFGWNHIYNDISGDWEEVFDELDKNFLTYLLHF